MITVKVIADSVSRAGARLTTFQCRYPRCILAEVNTHGMLTKSSASSRAIPLRKMIQQVREDPFIPLRWWKNQPGMQAAEELPESLRPALQQAWLVARDFAVLQADYLGEMGLHKQIANRILEPWMWTESIFTATEWGNFFALRDHPDAETHFGTLAHAMVEAYRASTPRLLEVGEWHLPYVQPGENIYIPDVAALRANPWMKWIDLIKYSVARCARVSYRNHDGTEPDLKADVALHDKLVAAGHMSPMGHQGQALPQGNEESGNFRGFLQYRKTIPGENRTHPAVEEWKQGFHAGEEADHG